VHQADSSCEAHEDSSGEALLSSRSPNEAGFVSSVKDELDSSCALQEEVVSSCDVEVDSSCGTTNEPESSSYESNPVGSSSSASEASPTKRVWSSSDPIPPEFNACVLVKRLPDFLLNICESTAGSCTGNETDSSCEVLCEMNRSSGEVDPLKLRPFVRLEKIPLSSLDKKRTKSQWERETVGRQVALEHDYVSKMKSPKRSRIVRFRRKIYSGRYSKTWC